MMEGIMWPGDVKHPPRTFFGGGRFGQGQPPKEKSNFVAPDRIFCLPV